MRHPTRHLFRPRVEVLEGRCNPAGTVTGTFADGVWTLTGDGAGNDITVNSNGTPGEFTVTGNATAVAGVTAPTGVKAIVFNMGGDTDVVVMNDNATPIKLTNLTFNGGDGGSLFGAAQLTVKKNLKITNGNGFDIFVLTDFQVGRSMTIQNGDGGSQTTLDTDSAAAGFNTIGRHLKVFNGAGKDITSVTDTNVGGNILNLNGAGARGTAGQFVLHNADQFNERAVIGGSVAVSFADGDVEESGIWEAKVKGDVTFNTGSGPSLVVFDGFATALPVVIKGDVTVNGTGENLVSVGLQDEGTGMVVGGDLLIESSDDDPLEQANLQVNGQLFIVLIV